MAWVEAKMRYATDAVESPVYVVDGKNGLAADVAKLRKAEPHVVPLFLLVWAPYYGLARRPLRYSKGHLLADGAWRPRVRLDQCRDAMAVLLDRLGRNQMVPVMSGTGEDGEITLDAWWVRVDRETAA